MPIFKFKNFKASTHIPPSSKNVHDLWKGTFKGSNRLWFCKAVENIDVAYIELIAQEFFRLLIPYQPETRLTYDKETGIYYIMSEEVPNFNYSESYFRKQIKTGLGKTLLLALFLEEDDLKFNNIGLDDQNRVIKIDGGLCFSGDKRHYNLSNASIDGLPFPVDCEPNYWLDIVKNGKRHTGSFIVDHNLSTFPEFRNDVNQAILQICLIPDSFIINFVDFLLDGDSKKEIFINKLLNRRDALHEVALNNPSFLFYLNTTDAEQKGLDFLHNLMNFGSARKSLISIIDQKEELMVGFYYRKRALITYYPNSLVAIKKELQAYPGDQRFLKFYNWVDMAEKLIPVTENFEKLNKEFEVILELILTFKQNLQKNEDELSIKIDAHIICGEVEECENESLNESLQPSNFKPGFWQNHENLIAKTAEEKAIFALKI